MEEYVLRLEVVMNNFVRQLMQIADRIHHLTDDQLCLLFWDLLVLLEIVGQIRAFAELEDCAEGRSVDLDCVVELHDVGMGQ
jgi:hypothetical protein